MTLEEAMKVTEPETSTSYFVRPLSEFSPVHLSSMVSKIMTELAEQERAAKTAAETAQTQRNLARANILGEKPRAEERSRTGRKRRSDYKLPRGPKPAKEEVQP